MPPAFFCDQTIMAWLALEATRIWAQHGPGRTLIGPVSHVPYAISSLRQDRRTGHRLMRRVLAVGEARGHEPETSQARFLYALGVSHWFEPLEDTVSQVLRAREGLILGGRPAQRVLYPLRLNVRSHRLRAVPGQLCRRG